MGGAIFKVKLNLVPLYLKLLCTNNIAFRQLTQRGGYLQLNINTKREGSFLLLVSAESLGMSQEVSAKTEFKSGFLFIHCSDCTVSSRGYDAFFDPWILDKFFPDLGSNS